MKHVPATSGSGDKEPPLIRQENQRATAEGSLRGGVFGECYRAMPPFNPVVITFDEKENPVFTPLPTHSNEYWKHLPNVDLTPLRRDEVYFHSSTLQHSPKNVLDMVLRVELERLNSREQNYWLGRGSKR